jgi:RNA polymerase sigma factor (sigma-70 family)
MKMMDLSDADLVAQSLTGSRDAFGRIVARYQSLICALNYSATGDLNQSEDLAQETFLTAWKELAKLREPAKLRSWLCRISRNITYDTLKQQGREPSHAAEPLDAIHESPAPEPQPHDFAMSKEEEAILWRSIERIPEIYREPLVLFYREHQSISAVAQSLELSEDAVKQRLSRGRKLLHEQVLAFVEGALERTNPGKAFTVAVLAALPALTISAKAAALGATAAKGSAAAKAAGAMGLFGAIFSPLLVFFGNYAGYRMSLDAAHSDEERGRIKAIYKKCLGFTLIFTGAFGALVFWACRNQKGHATAFELLFNGFIVIFLITLLVFVVTTLRKRRRFLAGLLQEEGTAAAAKPAYEYRSRWHLFGLPLVHICIGDRFAILKKPVTAWIAVGDCAVGGLFAFGGVAMAPLSIGGCAIGLLPFGGLAAGILTLGGLGLGVWTFGGCAIGWQALGGCAIAWKASLGGISFAHDFAMGGIAQAAQANNEMAKQFIEPNWFFHYGQIICNYCFWLNLLWVIPMLLQWRVIARKRRAAIMAAFLLTMTAFSVPAQPATTNAAFDPKQRFDDLVRDDFFSDDPEKFKHGMKICEDALAKNPQNAPALVWHGSGLTRLSAEPFQKGDFVKGMELWDRGLKEMDTAVALQPDSLQTVVPRGATLLGIAKYTPDLAARKRMIQTGVGDYEKILQLQTGYFTNLSTHSRGEVLFGLADGWYRIGETNKSTQYLRRIVHDLPDSQYAARAQDWLDTADAAALLKKSSALQCMGCHER